MTESVISERDILKSKKDKTDEDYLKIWDLNIEEILQTGNISTDMRGSKMFSDKFDKREMILECLVRKLSIKEGIHYSISFGYSSSPEMHLVYDIKNQDDKGLVSAEYFKKDIVDLIVEVENILTINKTEIQ